MTAHNAASGLVTSDSGTGSSALAGQNAYLAANKANAVAGAQNALAQHNIDVRQLRLDHLMSLLSGARGQAQGTAMAGLGGQSGIDNDLASQYGSLATYMDNKKMATNNAITGAIPSIAQMFA